MLHIASSAVIDVQATRKTNKPQELWDRSSWLLGITHLKENISKSALHTFKDFCPIRTVIRTYI